MTSPGAPLPDPLVDLDAADDEARTLARPPRRGFLPIRTNWFDRLFISVYIAVALILLWMRFLEPNGIPIWICYLLVVALGVVIVRRG
jgi:predicted small integral membrane protein